jgi:hypothetical protein
MLKKNIFGMMTFVVGVVLVSGLIGCDTGNGPDDGGNPQTATYTGGDYRLEITENTGRAAYTPATGDNFKFIEVISTNTMWGTIEMTGNGQTITLHPNNGSGTITVRVYANTILSITGMAFWDDNNQQFTGPGNLEQGGGFTAGWPGANILAQFGLTGLTAPTEATNIEHYVSTGRGLIINFKGGIHAHDNHVISGFTRNDWTYKMNYEAGDFSYWEGSSWSDETGCYYVLRKGDDGGTYGRSTSTGDCSISIVKDDYAD